MQVRDALEQHVRRRLEDTFGKAVAMLIWATAHGASGISSIDPDRDGYLRFVQAVCADQRVIDLWGRAGADSTLRQWRELV
jgi:hypothetical protein